MDKRSFIQQTVIRHARPGKNTVKIINFAEESWRILDEMGYGVANTREASKAAYTEEFDVCWSAYPSRPNNNKHGAYKAFSKRVSEGVKPNYLLERTKAYFKFCEITEKIGKEIVLQAATFYGPNKRYEDDFTPPKEALVPGWSKMPGDNNKLQAWAVANDFQMAPPNMSYPEYRNVLQQAVDNRLRRESEQANR